jgi:hypothetical protein
MKRYVLFLGVTMLLLLAAGAVALLPGPQASAHSGAEQLGVYTLGRCSGSPTAFVAATASGYNQYGNYVTWRWSGAPRCSIVTSNWWWQMGRGVKVRLSHITGNVSCKIHTADDNWWDPWNTPVWSSQSYDDHQC